MNKAVLSTPWATIQRFICGFLAIFFLIFACDFLYEQIEAVAQNQTTVETYKNMVGKPVIIAIGCNSK